MTSSPTPTGPHAKRHDEAEQWRESDFINAWVTKDDERPNDRLEPMRDALAATPYAKDTAIRALDVGAGYGMFAAEVLKAFPNAVVTLQDVSEPMFDISRERLADQIDQLRFVRSDMRTSAWVDELDGPFDLAVSSIAIHNLYDDGHIARVYKEIHDVLKPGATFINLDHIHRVGGVEGQTAWLRDAGFTEVQCLDVSRNISRLTARKAG